MDKWDDAWRINRIGTVDDDPFVDVRGEILGGGIWFHKPDGVNRVGTVDDYPLLHAIYKCGEFCNGGRGAMGKQRIGTFDNQSCLYGTNEREQGDVAAQGISIGFVGRCYDHPGGGIGMMGAIP